MKLLLVPGLPAAFLCIGIDTRAATAPPAVLATIDTFPIAIAVLILLFLLLRIGRRT